MNKLSTPIILSAVALAALVAVTLLIGTGSEPSSAADAAAVEARAASAATDAAANDRVVVTAGIYAVDPAHSEVGFRVRHLGLSTVRGLFNDVDGVVEFTDDHLGSLKAKATIGAASIYTNEADRDDHLRSADFFDAENHPEITFVSGEVISADGKEFTVTGDLTIRGVTKPVVLEGEYLGSAVDPWGNDRVALQAEGTINRTDYGLNWNEVLETGGFLVGEEVTLVLDVQAVRQEG